MDIEKAKEEWEWLKKLCTIYEELNNLKEKSIELDKQLKTKEKEYVPIPYYPIPYNPHPNYPFNPPCWCGTGTFEHSEIRNTTTE